MLPTRTSGRMGTRRDAKAPHPAINSRRSAAVAFAKAMFAAVAAAALVACGESEKGGAVTPPPPAQVHAVRVTPEAPSALVGASVQLTATPVDAQGNPLERPVTWQSLAPQVATVDATGRALAVGAGEATIVATSGTVSGNVRLTVTRPAVAAVALSAIELTLDPAQSHQLVATVKDATGSELTDRVVAWSSSNPQVATVDPIGRVVGVAEGVAVIAAMSEGVRAQLTVTVRPVPVARVVLSATHADLEPGEDVQIVARPEAADGSALTGRQLFWGSSNPAVVEPQGNGRLRAHMTGAVTITVSSEGKSTQMTVTVHPRPSRPLTFDRVSASGNEIFVQQYDGALARLNAGNVSRHPSASPDGQRFVFAVTQRDLTTNQLIHDLFVVDRNGMNIRHLTKMAGVETEPVWSPDGTKIAFSGSEGAGAALDIFVINVDGTGLTNLTADMPFSYEHAPAWSPDGTMLAFASLNIFGHSHIYTMNADGSGRTMLTSATGESAAHPTWSPDGSQVAFARSYAGTGVDIVIMTRQGRVETRLAVAGDQGEPVWSPNGEHFAFTTRAGDDEYVGTMRVDGAAVRLRTKGRNPAWLLR
ncbi:MAG TPA: Ig-like domain-containing protein [Gemmatimonadaceae bacterium]|nr:Ig-like domain-containing protein [Gemmatimonadaceae bacterium]